MEYEGEGPRVYDVAIEGAASRIASISTQGDLSPGDPLIVDIEPMGLMESGMYARGQVVVQDGFVRVPRKPGLGITVDEELVQKYAV